MLEFAPASVALSYEEALLYCQFCNHGGYNDWRMPTSLEWFDVAHLHGWYRDRLKLLTLESQVVPVRDATTLL
jgi:hypothetical protein